MVYATCSSKRKRTQHVNQRGQREPHTFHMYEYIYIDMDMEMNMDMDMLIDIDRDVCT